MHHKSADLKYKYTTLLKQNQLYTEGILARTERLRFGPNAGCSTAE
jgi:hypothetical protein